MSSEVALQVLQELQDRAAVQREIERALDELFERTISPFDREPVSQVQASICEALGWRVSPKTRGQIDGVLRRVLVHGRSRVKTSNDSRVYNGLRRRGDAAHDRPRE